MKHNEEILDNAQRDRRVTSAECVALRNKIFVLERLLNEKGNTLPFELFHPLLKNFAAGIELPWEMDGDDAQSTSTNDTSTVDVQSHEASMDDPLARSNQIRRHTVGIAPKVEHGNNTQVLHSNMSPRPGPPQRSSSSLHPHSPSSPGANVASIDQRGNAANHAFIHGRQQLQGNLTQRNLSELGMQRANHPGTPLHPDPRNSMAQEYQSSTPAARSGAIPQQQRRADFDMSSIGFHSIFNSGKLSPIPFSLPLIELCSS